MYGEFVLIRFHKPLFLLWYLLLLDLRPFYWISYVTLFQIDVLIVTWMHFLYVVLSNDNEPTVFCFIIAYRSKD